MSPRAGVKREAEISINERSAPFRDSSNARGGPAGFGVTDALPLKSIILR